MIKNFYYFVLIIFPICIFAQNKDTLKTYQLSDIVISATRTENPIMELANSITIIDSTEISRRNKTSVFDLLKDEYGISFTQQGGANKLSSISIRGSNSNHTLVLIDGVEVNMPSDPGNSYDFSFLTPDNVERIEVLRGPQSTLYGSNAMAGVINIITKKGSGRPKFLVEGEGGSYGTYRGVAGLNGSIDMFNYSVSLSRFKTSGFSSASSRYGNTERDGSDNYNFSSRFGLDINNNLSFNLFYRFEKDFSNLDQWGGLHGDDPTYKNNMEEYELKGETELSLFDSLWNQTLGVSIFRNVRKSSFDSTTFNPNSSRSIYDGKKVKFDWQNNIQFNNWNLVTLGIESFSEGANSEYNSSISIYNDTLANRIVYTTGLYIQDQLKVMNNFFATVGVRFDKHNRFGGVTTYRIAPAYIIPGTGTKLKFTYGTAFHSPSLYDLYDPTYGNSSLKPEKSKGWDAGIEQHFPDNKFSIGLTYFNNQFVDLFGYGNNFRTVNIDKAETYGVEFFSAAEVTPNAKFKVNYTYTKAIELQGPDKDLPLLRRPNVKIDFILYYTISDKFNAMAELTFLSARDDEDFSSFVRVILPAYGIINLSASYNVYSYLDIYGRVDNLFNNYYEEIYGYGTAGLSGYIGFKLNF
jgi:vitamin B12 transporter